MGDLHETHGLILTATQRTSSSQKTTTANKTTTPRTSAVPMMSRKELSKYFHRPITEVAKELGICETMLKKMCREQGIARWPHRKIASLTALIRDIEDSLAHPVVAGLSPEMRAIRLEELSVVRNKLRCIVDDPNAPVDITRAVVSISPLPTAVAAASTSPIVACSPPDSPSPVTIAPVFSATIADCSNNVARPPAIVLTSPTLPSFATPSPNAAAAVTTPFDMGMSFHEFVQLTASPLACPLTEFLGASDDALEKIRSARPAIRLFFPQ